MTRSNSSCLSKDRDPAEKALPLATGWVPASTPHPCLALDDGSCTHRCFGGFDTSASLRQASSSWARVLGGVRGGIAGSWVNGWARGAARGCPLLLPHRWCRPARSAGDARADSKG